MKGKTALLAILVAMLVSAGLRMSGFSFFGSKTDPRSQEFLSKVAAEINKNAPVPVDADTEMIGAEGLEGVLVYKYRLVNLSADELDAAQVHEAMKPQLTAGACGTPQTREKFLDQGIALRYVYSDKDLRPVTQIDVTGADCGA